ncbi:hypothetical protein [Halogeometricum sp. CBA1124]|uniref:NADH-quinone oxidoreductase subunit D-related protein n=1 Tax=Halogeometricum sp. CBA1124 TaxID=2668071 RepID=UPI001748E1B9
MDCRTCRLDPDINKPYGCTAPVLRESRIDHDLRCDGSYGYYGEFDWSVVIQGR